MTHAGAISVHEAGQAKKYVSPEVVQRLLKLGDFCAMVLAGFGLFFSAPGLSADALALPAFLTLTMAFLALFVLREAGLYGISALVRPAATLPREIAIVAMVGVTGFGAGRLVGDGADWRLFAGWVLVMALFLVVSRLAVALWAVPRDRAGAFRRRIAIVGGGEAAEKAIDTLEASPGLDVEIVGLFDDRRDSRSPEHIRKYRKLGNVADLHDYARHNRVDLIIVAIPLSAEKRLLEMLRQLWELPVDIRISGQASRLKLAPRAYDHLGDLPLLTVFELPLTDWGWFLKGVMDRVLAAGMLVAFAPVMAAVALAIRWESRGPVLFRQKRYGFNNELIEVYKFRSMYVDRCDADASRLVTRDDPRVTKVGRFIRRTSLDELPQLFNVLRGELSLVGPRPHATQAKAAGALYQDVVNGYFARHKVKPGITGWAQINGWRGETDTSEKIENRVKYDLEYIDNWSLLFDLYIILKTPFSLLSGANARNAY